MNKRTLAEVAENENQLLPGIISKLKETSGFLSVLLDNAIVTDKKSIVTLSPSGKQSYNLSLKAQIFARCDNEPTPFHDPVLAFSEEVMYAIELIGRRLEKNIMEGVSEQFIKSVAEQTNDSVADVASNYIRSLDSQITKTVAQAKPGNFELSDLDNLFDLAAVNRTEGKVLVCDAETYRTVKSKLVSLDAEEKEIYDIPVMRSMYGTPGHLHLVDLNDFKLYFGADEDADTPFEIRKATEAVYKLYKLDKDTKDAWIIEYKAQAVLGSDFTSATLTDVS